MEDHPQMLRELAAWYREFAETASPSIREARLLMAADLEREATQLEQHDAEAFSVD